MKWKNLTSFTSTFFITATINDWQPLLAYETPRDILLNDLHFYQRKYNALIQAYVIMPEHYHVIITLESSESLHGWLRDVHSHSANQISAWLRKDIQCKQPEIEGIVACLQMKTGRKSQLTVWKEQARAEGIISIAVLEQKLEYIHANPVRRMLVRSPADWQWSSWRAYFTDEKVDLPIEPIRV